LKSYTSWFSENLIISIEGEDKAAANPKKVPSVSHAKVTHLMEDFCDPMTGSCVLSENWG
jgi:hypothetical protein